MIKREEEDTFHMPIVKVQQTFLSFAHNYKLFNHPNGSEMGIARGKVFKIRPSYIVSRSDGSKWFKIQRNLFKTKYTIKDAQGKYLGHYQTPFFILFKKTLKLIKNKVEYPAKGSFWALDFEVHSSNGQGLLKVSKKLLQIRDSFLVEYADGFDQRLAISAAIVADDRYHPAK